MALETTATACLLCSYGGGVEREGPFGIRLALGACEDKKEAAGTGRLASYQEAAVKQGRV